MKSILIDYNDMYVTVVKSTPVLKSAMNKKCIDWVLIVSFTNFFPSNHLLTVQCTLENHHHFCSDTITPLMILDFSQNLKYPVLEMSSYLGLKQ